MLTSVLENVIFLVSKLSNRFVPRVCVSCIV